MKILLITDHHHPQGGGAEKHFFALKKALQTVPDIEVVSLGFGAKGAVSDDAIVLIANTSSWSQLLWRLLFHPRKYWQLRQAIRRIQPDVIHLHNFKKYTFSLLAALRGYPLVQTVHDYTLLCPTYWNLHNDLQPCATGLTRACWTKHKRQYPWPVYFVLLYWFFHVRYLLKKQARLFIAPSPLLAAYLEKNQFTPAVYIPPFKIAAVAPHYERMQAKHFLFIGQLGNHKGLPILLREFALACQTCPDLRLSIAGSGKASAALQKLARKLGIQQNIHWLGWVTNAQSLYESCTALIFPSLWLEAFGMVITEAMCHARAVIGSHRGPTAWLVEDGKTGLLFDPLKKGDLAAKIVCLAEDIQLAKQYGENGLARWQTLPDNDAIVAAVLEGYRGVLV